MVGREDGSSTGSAHTHEELEDGIGRAPWVLGHHKANDRLCGLGLQGIPPTGEGGPCPSNICRKLIQVNAIARELRNERKTSTDWTFDVSWRRLFNRPEGGDPMLAFGLLLALFFSWLDVGEIQDRPAGQYGTVAVSPGLVHALEGGQTQPPP